MDAALQEWLALGFVTLVAGALVAYRRRRKAGGCGDCASTGKPPRETVVRFHRRVEPPAGTTRNGHGPRS